MECNSFDPSIYSKNKFSSIFPKLYKTNDIVHCYDHIVSVTDEWPYMKHWWNDADNMGKPKYLEKTCPCATFFQHKSHTDCPGIEIRPP
jgi:hypothetical protein